MTAASYFFGLPGVLAQSYATDHDSDNDGLIEVVSLVGRTNDSAATGSYFAGVRELGGTRGGLVGDSFGSVSSVQNSYYDTSRNGNIKAVGFGASRVGSSAAKTTLELQAPTSSTGIYENWDAAVWDFGGSTQYPVLKVDFDRDGTATWQEFGQQREDYDDDDDGLIEVASLAQLDAFRWDLSGDGDPDSSADDAKYFAAFNNHADGMGCPSTGCTGYELTADLDFDSDGDGDVDANDHAGAWWNSGAGWDPIDAGAGWDPTEDRTKGFVGTLEGNGHTISNLFINYSGTGNVSIGLFEMLGGTHDTSQPIGVVRNLGLVNASVSGGRRVGALAGLSHGVIEHTYVTGFVTQTDSSSDAQTGAAAGLMVGWADFGRNKISGSFTIGTVASAGLAGGIAGRTNGGYSVENSYSVAVVQGSGKRGGLAGNPHIIRYSYFAGQLPGSGTRGGLHHPSATGTTLYTSYFDKTLNPSAEGSGGKTTADLQSPTSASGIYSAWPTAFWDFRLDTQYPLLKADWDGDGTATWSEFGPQRDDYDTDDDGLIEVHDLAQLNAIRWDLNGDGDPDSDSSDDDYAAAFPNAEAGMGCKETASSLAAGGCSGYELAVDLDFDTDGNGSANSEDDYWNSGAGWDPIGGAFTANFDGGGHTISNLFISSGNSGNKGLFAEIKHGADSTKSVRYLGLVDVSVTGGSNAGGLVGASEDGNIRYVYVSGAVSTGGSYAGLIAGVMKGAGASIDNSYSAGTVTINNSSGYAGGLTGALGLGVDNGSTISDSYSTATLGGSGKKGGLVGSDRLGNMHTSYFAGVIESGGVRKGLVASVSATRTYSSSYWDTQTSGVTTSAAGVGKTTSELQTPTIQGGIYTNWLADEWDFGASTQYPAIKADFNRDGTAGWQEFGTQRGDGPVLTCTPGNGEAILTWTAVQGVTGWEYRQNTGGSTSNTTWTAMAGSGATTARHEVTGLSNGDGYDFEVRSYTGTGANRVDDAASNKATVEVADQVPTLTGSIAAQELIQGTAYTSAAAFPAATGGDEPLAYSVGSLPSGVTLNSDGKLTGTSTAPLAKTSLTYTVTDAAGDADNANDDDTQDTAALTFSISVAPKKPANFSATAGSGRVTLSWDRNAGVSGWEVKKDSGAWTSISDTDTTVRHTVTGLTGGTEYAFRIRAFVGDGGALPSTRVDGVASDVRTATPAAALTAPGAPTSVTATSGDAQVTLSWSAPSSGGAVAGYQVRSKTKAGTWPAASPFGWADTTGRSRTFTGLANGMEYTFEVRAKNAAGAGAAVSKDATPVAPPLLAAPTSVNATVLDGWTVLLSWTAPSGTVNGYEYRHRQCPCDGGPAWSAAKQLGRSGVWLYLTEAYTPPTSADVLGLPAGVRGIGATNQVQIRAVNGVTVSHATASQQRGSHYKGEWSATQEVVLEGARYHKRSGTWGASAAPADTTVTFGWTLPIAGDVLARHDDSSVQIAWWKTADGVPEQKRWVNATSYGAAAVTGSYTTAKHLVRPSTQYSYQIAYQFVGRRYVQTDSDGDEVTHAFTTQAQHAPPPAPSIAVKPGDAKMLVCWQPVEATPAVTRYEYRFFALIAGGGDHPLAGDWQSVDKSATSQHITGLDNGIIYLVQMRAVNPKGPGDSTDWQTVTPTATTPTPTCN